MHKYLIGIFYGALLTTCEQWTPIVVKNVTYLGPQLSPDITDVSRDGGYSALINGNIVWLYDDTECLDSTGRQLSFISNTAAYVHEPDQNISIMADFGVAKVGKDSSGSQQYAILADTSVETGGWISFQSDELRFNNEKKNKERVAIWPGTSPTPISTGTAFMFAPIVFVDMKPQDPAKEYQPRGMTLLSITAPASGPVATRHGNIVIAESRIGYGGFSALLGLISTDVSARGNSDKRDVYLVGVAKGGLQLARVALDHLGASEKYTYFHPQTLSFTSESPDKDLESESDIYMPGTFSSGSVFYSAYFATFIMVYFNKLADSTFYIRYLDLSQPLQEDQVWTREGRFGQGIDNDDAEALVKYAWSAEQKLCHSPPGRGGFNYAGVAHPEYFNRQYFAKSLYEDNVPNERRRNDWYGSALISEADAGSDGKHLLLSWTSQMQNSQKVGLYQIQLAIVEFDRIPRRPGADALTSSATNPSGTSSARLPPHRSEATKFTIKLQGSDTDRSLPNLNFGGRFSKWLGCWQSILTVSTVLFSVTRLNF